MYLEKNLSEKTAKESLTQSNNKIAKRRAQNSVQVTSNQMLESKEKEVAKSIPLHSY